MNKQRDKNKNALLTPHGLLLLLAQTPRLPVTIN